VWNKLNKKKYICGMQGQIIPLETVLVFAILRKKTMNFAAEYIFTYYFVLLFFNFSQNKTKL